MADVRVFTKVKGAPGVDIPGYGRATYTKGVMVPEKLAAELVDTKGLQIRRSEEELLAMSKA